MPSGTLVGQALNQRNSGKYQCFVKNDYGTDFSRKLEVNVTGTKCSIIPDVLSVSFVRDKLLYLVLKIQ